MALKKAWRWRGTISQFFFLSPIRILEFDGRAAEEYGKIRTELEKRGMSIGSMDTLVAGYARFRDILKERYRMVFSDKLKHVIKKYDLAKLYKELLIIQEKRYKEVIVSPGIINNILEECSRDD